MYDEYVVCCDFDVSASCPSEAAKEINEWLDEGGEWVFKIQNKRTKEFFLVDMGIGSCEQIKPKQAKIFNK